MLSCRLVRALILVLASALPGCLKSSEDGAATDATPPELPQASVTLRVAVVNDAPLRRAIDRLRGEWTALTGGAIETTIIDTQALLDQSRSSCDIVVFPSRLLGELCEAERIREMRPSVLKMELLRYEDLLPVVRGHEILYGESVMALPLGVATPLVLRHDEDPGGSPQGVRTPSDPAQLALAYLAWAAPHAVHRGRETVLFDAEDFSPRLTTPPFVRGLDAFCAACQEEDAGESVIIWPERQRALEIGQDGVRVARVPGAEEVYNQLAERWEPLSTASRNATLAASRGRLIGVSAGSRNAASAFRLAAWLAGVENASALSTSSSGVAICRGSLSRAGDPWREGISATLAAEFSRSNAEALRASRVLIAPRFPAADRYLISLGESVGARVTGEMSTEQALGRAAEAWEAITEELGRERQHRAYLRSVNAARFAPAFSR